MINDRELKFLQQVAKSIVYAAQGDDMFEEDLNENKYYQNILNALINKYIDTVKDESNERN
jgi:hypothetical protein